MEEAQEMGVGVVAEVPSSDMSQAVHQEQQESSPRAQAIPQDEEFPLGILREKKWEYPQLGQGHSRNWLS